MTKRRVHLGIDYGTSASKLVLRDYGAAGEEKAYLIGWHDKDGHKYRHPSYVAVNEGRIYLGCRPQHAPANSVTCYESVKMRVADDVKNTSVHFYGVAEPFPEGFKPQDFAVLSVWWLISRGHRAARRLLGTDDIGLGMTLGVPMSFFVDPELKAAFLRIARAAWHLYRTRGPRGSNTLRFSEAEELLAEAYEGVATDGELHTDAVRAWLRSEAEAAMLWPFKSPSINHGPYIEVDIGAGTTNCSMFMIAPSFQGGRWVKSGLSFFGVHSCRYGMDALDHALARFLKMADGDCRELRMKEAELLREKRFQNASEEVFDNIRSAIDEACRAGFAKIRGNRDAYDQWERDAKLFVFGGGSRVESLCRHLSKHPYNKELLLDPLRPGTAGCLDMPDDLFTDDVDDPEPPTGALPFVAVAYGLSNLHIAVPEAETPDDVPPVPPTNSPRSGGMTHEEIYGVD
jgi:hypothetical protein